jgi:uncharacterized membrane protein YoaK (UPF0700 family)
LTIDLAVLVRGKGDPEDLSRARHRVRLTLPSVAGFIAGCAAGGFLEVHFGLWALALPVVLAATATPLGAARTMARAEVQLGSLARARAATTIPKREDYGGSS